MDFSNYNIGLGITGSFCTFAKARKEIQNCHLGDVVPIFCLMRRPVTQGLAARGNM